MWIEEGVITEVKGTKANSKTIEVCLETTSLYIEIVVSLDTCKNLKGTEDNEAGVNVVVDEIQDALALVDESTHDTWVFDSSASFHIATQRDILTNCVAGNHGNVYLADGEPLDIIGIGDVNIKLASG